MAISRNLVPVIVDRTNPTEAASHPSRVGINYHIEVADHNYSVPYQLVGKEVEARYTKNTVEIQFGNRRVASHRRSHKKWGYTTLAEHMPEAHREHAKWTPERMARWAGEAGPAAADVAQKIMSSKPHPQQGFRAVLGLIRLGEQYGSDRLEKPCTRAIKIHSPTYKSVKSILKSGLEDKPLPAEREQTKPIQHQNIRGAEYFH